jgi:ABC-type lipoprotein export system ATPase subunit
MLRSIEINNFLCCRSTRVRFNEKINALVGRNGVGKTTLLKCLEWLAQWVVAGNAVFSEAGRYARVGADRISLTVELRLGESDYDYTLEHPSALHLAKESGLPVVERLRVARHGSEFVTLLDRTGEEIRIADRDDAIRIARYTPAMIALWSLLPGGDPLVGAIFEIVRFFGELSYYTLQEPARASDLVPESGYLQWRQGTGRPKSFTESVSLRIIHMHNKEPKMLEEFRHLMGPMGLDVIRDVQVQEILAPLVPSDGGVPTGSAAKTEKHYWLSFEPAAHMGGSGSSFFFSQLSLGTRRTIRAVTYLLFDRPSLMLLEHPEDSIHPGLLRKLIDIFRSYSAYSQIVFTTHSPEVLDLLRPKEVLLVTASDGQTTARGLTSKEVLAAKRYLQNEGSLSDFIEQVDE